MVKNECINMLLLRREAAENINIKKTTFETAMSTQNICGQNATVMTHAWSKDKQH